MIKKPKKFTDTKINNWKINGRSINWFEINVLLNIKLAIAEQYGSIFNQINKLTIKIYSHQRYVNIILYLKFSRPKKPRQFLKNTFSKSSICSNSL